MVRLTDRPDKTLDVYHGRKTTPQQQQHVRVVLLTDMTMSQSQEHLQFNCMKARTHTSKYKFDTFLLSCRSCIHQRYGYGTLPCSS